MAESRHPIRTAALTAFLAFGTWRSPALASDTFPEKIQQTLDMACAPQCTLCHMTNDGQRGTVRKPFGEAALDLGLTSGDADCIPKLLAALETGATGNACTGALQEPGAGMGAAGAGAGTPVDSDGDGTTDIAELRADDDPNTPGGEGLCVLKYGCGARVAPQPPVGWFGAGAAALAVALLIGRARRSRR